MIYKSSNEIFYSLFFIVSSKSSVLHLKHISVQTNHLSGAQQLCVTSWWSSFGTVWDWRHSRCLSRAPERGWEKKERDFASRTLQIILERRDFKKGYLFCGLLFLFWITVVWVWVNSGTWWWTGRPGMLLFIGWQRDWHDWDWTELRVMSLIGRQPNEVLETTPVAV